MSAHTRMTIGECVSIEETKRFAKLYREAFLPYVQDLPGYRDCQLLTETDGRMVVILTTFDTEANCVAFHSSRLYRSLVRDSEHLLLGGFVVKMFKAVEFLSWPRPIPTINYKEQV